jgi:hypothetical protein
MQTSPRDQSCGTHTTVSCIMTMPQFIHHTWSRVSWPSMAGSPDFLPSWHDPLWFLAIPNIEDTAKRLLFWMRTSYRTQGRSCTPFQNKPSRSASGDGRTAGLSVWSHKEPTLKGIRYCNHPDTEFCFPGPRSDTFWTGLVYHIPVASYICHWISYGHSKHAFTQFFF